MLTFAYLIACILSLVVASGHDRDLISSVVFEKIAFELPNGFTQSSLEMVPFKTLSINRKWFSKKPSYFSIQYQKSPSGSFDIAKIIPQAKSDFEWTQDRIKFLVWEMGQYPDVDRMYHLMSQSHDFARALLESGNPRIQSIMPQIFELSFLQNSKLLETILRYPKLIDWGTYSSTLKRGYIMKHLQLAQILQTSHLDASSSYKFPEIFLETISGQNWGKLLGIALRERLTTAAKLILEDQRVLSTIPNIGLFFRRQLTDPSIAISLAASLGQDHVAHYIPGSQWVSLFESALITPQYSYSAGNILNHPGVIRTLSEDDAERIIQSVERWGSIYMNMIEVFTKPAFSSKVSGSTWGSFVLFAQNHKLQYMVPGLLESEDIAQRIPDTELRQILQKIISSNGDTIPLMKVLASANLKMRITNQEWTALINRLLTQSNHFLAGLALQDSDIMTRILDADFKMFFDKIIQLRSPALSVIEALSASHNFERLTSSDWTLLLTTLISRQQDHTSSFLLQDPKIVSALSDETVSHLMELIVNQHWIRRDIFHALTSPHIVSRVSSEEWIKIFQILISRFDGEWVAVLAMNDSIIAKLPKPERIELFKWMFTNAPSIVPVAPVSFAKAAGSLAKHSLLEASDRVQGGRTHFPPKASLFAGTRNHPKRVVRLPPHIHNSLPYIRNPRIPKVI